MTQDTSQDQKIEEKHSASSKRKKTITILKELTDDQISQIGDGLKSLSPPQKKTLKGLVEIWFDIIEDRRKEGVSWTEISSYLSNQLDTEITENSLSQAFAYARKNRSKRKQQLNQKNDHEN